ncbi:hypothetical protein [Nannocystis bainbridge]|uniref:AP2 domain-containing protein n=1 Tax=Nannocystis bainbridge TaxID=2995303 RepID=A0ABT5DRF7_9BACT|nr:hypothetical protein [Nannocystis bainbridge]MDC0716198.1 hypothetical protein [Nannocystis bainbridge]
MSEWTVETIRLTLYNGERKERVIVQKSNGDLSVSSKQRDKDEGDTVDDKPKQATEAKEANAKAKVAAQKPAQERKGRAGTPAPAHPPEPAKKGTSLEWAPIVDAGYDGFAAKSRGAELHVLKTSSGGWAIYVYWGRGLMKHITCHAKLGDAKKAAQALHDEGLPARPELKLTQEMIDNACPAPAQEAPPQAPRKPRTKRADTENGATETTAQKDPPRRSPPKPRAKKQANDAGETETKPAETKPAEGPSELTPELRTELRDSFKDAMVEAMKQAE